MKEQITSIEGATGVHKAAKSQIKSWIRTKGKGNVRQTIIDCNRHGWKRRTGPESVHGE